MQPLKNEMQNKSTNWHEKFGLAVYESALQLLPYSSTICDRN
jgi:hypothetical protein